MEAMEAAEIIVFDYSDNRRPNMVRAFSRSARARITSLAWSASSYHEGLSTIVAVRLRAALIRLRLAVVPEKPVSLKRALRRLSTSVSAVLAALVLIFVPTSAVHQLSYNTEALDGTVLAAPLVGEYVPQFSAPDSAGAHFERLDTGDLVPGAETIANSLLDFDKTARGMSVRKDIPTDILLFAPPLSHYGIEQVTLTEPVYEEPNFASVDLSGEAGVSESRILGEESVITAGETGGVERRSAATQTLDADNLSHFEMAAAVEADFAEARDDAYILPASGVLTSRFGYRKTSIGSSNHKGIDISGFYGEPIHAAGGGEVIVSGWSDSFGYVIHIQHDNGDVTLYSHCSKLLVGVGERVDQGQEIARMGQTGIASGVHLHFELIVNGVNVDPLLYLPNLP